MYALSTTIKDVADGVEAIIAAEKALSENTKALLAEIENFSTSLDALYKDIDGIYENLAWSFKYVEAAFADIEAIATAEKATFVESQNVFTDLVFRLSIDIKLVTTGLDTLSSGLGGMEVG